MSPTRFLCASEQMSLITAFVNSETPIKSFKTDQFSNVDHQFDVEFDVDVDFSINHNRT